jgi:hypothetical protein
MKRLLLWSAALVALAVLALIGAGVAFYARADASTVGELSFETS